jgi:hypothetical protein
MRLTLRTLLAWLDDTLSPGEVREIGRQVSDSQFAKELVERIHKVTRQRRLTVPPRTGPEAIDANVVASYLDNELDPELVAELEKKCLMSDVHLAEVASVHQILSLIGQKAKVPVEARRRMYQLVKGREAVKPAAPRASRMTEPKPVAEPLQPWTTPPAPTRPWLERYGPAAMVVGLILILCVSAWRTLRPPDSSARNLPASVTQSGADGAAAGLAAVEARPAPAAAPAPAPAAETASAEAPKAELSTAKTEVTKAEPTTVAEASPTGDAEKAKAAKPAADIPAGAVGLSKKPTGVLLRYLTADRKWERLNDAAGLRDEDRLLNLAPFRSTVELGAADVDLVGETEIWARATPGTRASRLSLAQGKIVLHGTSPSLPFEVYCDGKAVTITPPPGGLVGVERLNRRGWGEPKSEPAVLRIYAADGPVKVSAAGHDETLNGAGAVTVEPTGAFVDKVERAAPEWVADAAPSPFNQKIGEQFRESLTPGREILSGLVEASESDQKDVSRLAISGLRAAGDVSFVVPLLNQQGSPIAVARRRAAIVVLRDFLAQDPASAKVLHEQLQREMGDEQGATAEKLLVGYTAKEAKEPATYSRLVQIMGTNDPDYSVGLRELALDNIMRMTGRDDLEYDPENARPESKGLRAWATLARDNELHAADEKPLKK